MVKGMDEAAAPSDGQSSGAGTRVILQNEFATLVYHPRSRIVHHTFHQPVPTDIFRAVLTRGVELLEQRGATKWLSDDRGNTALHPDDAKWSMGEWTERASAAGWRFWAVVLPDMALGRASMRRFLKHHIERGLRVRVFEQPEDALRWLEAPEATSSDED